MVVSNTLRTRAIADAKAEIDIIDVATPASCSRASCLPDVWQPNPAPSPVLADRRPASSVGLRARIRWNRNSAILDHNLVTKIQCAPLERSG